MHTVYDSLEILTGGVEALLQLLLRHRLQVPDSLGLILRLLHHGEALVGLGNSGWGCR